MSKVQILSMITVFWLLLPFVFGFLGVGGFISIQQDLKDISKIEIQGEIDTDDSFFNSISGTFDYIKIFFKFAVIYLKVIFIWVTGLPLVFNLILWILRIVSGIVFLLILRGV